MNESKLSCELFVCVFLSSAPTLFVMVEPRVWAVSEGNWAECSWVCFCLKAVGAIEVEQSPLAACLSIDGELEETQLTVRKGRVVLDA